MIEHAPTPAATRPDGGSVPRRHHVVAGVLFGAGSFGLWGGLPGLWGLGLGALCVTACVIVLLTQGRRHPRPQVAFGVSPRSVLGGWAGGGPVLFMMVLPDDAGPALLLSLAALFATLLYAALRLEDIAGTARARASASADR